VFIGPLPPFARAALAPGDGHRYGEEALDPAAEDRWPSRADRPGAVSAIINSDGATLEGDKLTLMDVAPNSIVDTGSADARRWAGDDRVVHQQWDASRS